MKTYKNKLTELTEEALNTLLNLIDKKGVESDHISEKCLKIKENEVMFNLDNGRYLIEFTKFNLIDNEGYQYGHYALEVEKLMMVVDYLIKENNPEEDNKYVLSENAINGITINEKIQQEELHEYSIIERANFLDELIGWIGEAKKDSDKFLMKQDLEMLMKWEDDYILSSNSTNSYLGKHSSEFEETCKELLELNSEL